MIKKPVFVTVCDKCKKETEIEGDELTSTWDIGEIIVSEFGWISKDGLDICPECANEYQESNKC